MRDPKLLLELHQIPGFGAYLDEIRWNRPQIPSWSRDVSGDDWIYRSGLQAGFDIFAAFFEGDVDE